MADGPRTLGPDEIERYARHIVLPEIGGRGQQALAGARVAMVGAGGLGSPVLTYLAAAGVGHLTIIDDDGAPSLSVADASVTEGDSGTVSAPSRALCV